MARYMLSRVPKGRLCLPTWSVALLALVLGAGFESCSAPGTRAHTYQPNLNAPLDSGAPPWADQPNSWAKLEAISSWLEVQGPRSDPFWRVEGRLQLAEGRMDFYREELGSLEPGAASQRLAAAKAGFMRVQSDPQANEGQLRRARRALATRVQNSSAPVRKRTLPAGVLPRSYWNAQQANPNRLTLASTPWRCITVHHSAVEVSQEAARSTNGIKKVLLGDQADHMNNRGWGDLGYHFLIDPAGRVYEGRSMRYQGAHAGGDQAMNNNVGNIGICLLGNFQVDRPSTRALESMKRLVKDLSKTHGIPTNAVRAHLDWTGTECPGRHLLPHVRRLSR